MSGLAISLSVLGSSAGVGGLVVAVLAYRRSGRAIGAAERSAAAAERSAEASMSSLDIERRRSAAQLALVVVNAKGEAGGGRVVFAIRNDGGSSATRVAPKEIILGGDVIFSVGGVADSIAPGDSRQFEGRSTSIAHRLERAEIKSVEYVDALGPHDVPLRWSRTA